MNSGSGLNMLSYELQMLTLLERMLLDESTEPIDLPLSLLQKITKNFSDDLQIGCDGSAVVYMVFPLSQFIYHFDFVSICPGSLQFQ